MVFGFFIPQPFCTYVCPFVQIFNLVIYVFNPIHKMLFNLVICKFYNAINKLSFIPIQRYLFSPICKISIIYM